MHGARVSRSGEPSRRRDRSSAGSAFFPRRIAGSPVLDTRAPSDGTPKGAPYGYRKKADLPPSLFELRRAKEGPPLRRGGPPEGGPYVYLKMRSRRVSGS